MATMIQSHGAHALTKPQRDELREALRAKRDELRHRRADAPNPHILEASADIMDTASDATTEADASSVASNDRLLLREIEAALARMRDGTYGVSEESGEPIPFERLRAIPWARRTAMEQESREARHR